MSEHCVTAYVYGAVQEVGIRYHTQQQARQLGVKGYARNCEDGSVEVVASGEPQQVEQLIIWLKGEGRAVLVLSAFLSSPAR